MKPAAGTRLGFPPGLVLRAQGPQGGAVPRSGCGGGCLQGQRSAVAACALPTGELVGCAGPEGTPRRDQDSWEKPPRSPGKTHHAGSGTPTPQAWTRRGRTVFDAWTLAAAFHALICKRSGVQLVIGDALARSTVKPIMGPCVDCDRRARYLKGGKPVCGLHLIGSYSRSERRELRARRRYQGRKP